MDIGALANKVIAGERRALAQAITLVESARADHREQAGDLLKHLRGTGREALRIGLSGTPGVGKSTFIEAMGMRLIGRDMRVAVLAVDPSSTRSGGSILGDKTRMERLSREPNAFIRPSPSQSHLGGVARRTREAIAICEAAGFDVVIIETVGVGQSEVMVAGMCDVFALLIAPAGGDELQGVKRGIMEIADMVLVNKADGDLEAAARRTQADYAGALGLMRKRAQDPEGFPLTLCVSAATGTGLDGAWEKVETLVAWRRENGHFQARRAEQIRGWFEEELRHTLLAVLDEPAVKQRLSQLGDAVAAGDLSPSDAVAEMLDRIGR